MSTIRSGDPREVPSLPDLHRSVRIPSGGSWLRRLIAFAGPAYLVSVGYMDPGNWATDLAGGARFGYQLIWVLLMSNLMAVLLQTMAARLGIVTGKDLAQACRDYYPRPFVIPLWVLCEIAIVACDLAEVLGAAIGLQLLFGIPVLWGVVITALDVLILLGLAHLGMRRVEAFVIALIATIGVCFAIEMVLSRPDMAALLRGFVPRDGAGAISLFRRVPGGGLSLLGLRSESLYIAIGIIGATVMPHNLYLHSALVQTRAVEGSREGKRLACHMNLVDSVVALNAAFFVNAAILVVAAAVFYRTGMHEVSRLEDAHRLLAPLLGTSLASTLFAVALLSSGQSSTITGTLAGQIVMEGFLRIRIRPWMRRLISRALAIIPAALCILLRGPGSVDDLLVLSQVVLSLQLAFAIIPLVTFTNDRGKMGEFVNPLWVKILAAATTILILVLNANLVIEQLGEWMRSAGPGAWWLWWIVLPAIAATALLLALLMLVPLLQVRLPHLRGPMHVPFSGFRPSLLFNGASVEKATPEVVLESLGPGRRLAVALELGPADVPVLARLRTTTFGPGTEILLLHVAESAASRYLGTEAGDLESREDLADLEALAAEFRARGILAGVRLGNGDPKRELARLTNEAAADLLVTGSHGHGLVKDILFGETTSGLRHLVRCPMLTIPMDRRGGSRRARGPAPAREHAATAAPRDDVPVE